MELSDLDREEIAKQVKDGFTSGIIDGENYRINWSLDADKWSDEEESSDLDELRGV